MKKQISLLLALAAMLSLAACGGSGSSSSSTTSSSLSSGSASVGSESSSRVDAVTTPSTYTNVYTNLDQTGLIDAITDYKGLCALSTVNSDGSSNNAIFVPGVVDADHIMFGLAENATRDNLIRTGEATMIYVIHNPAAEAKEGRYTGAVVKLKYVDEAGVNALMSGASEEIDADAVVCRIAEIKPIG